MSAWQIVLKSSLVLIWALIAWSATLFPQAKWPPLEHCNWCMPGGCALSSGCRDHRGREVRGPASVWLPCGCWVCCGQSGVWVRLVLLVGAGGSRLSPFWPSSIGKWNGTTSNLSKRPPAFHGHLSDAASLFLAHSHSLCTCLFVLNGHLSYAAFNFWYQEDCFRQNDWTRNSIAITRAPLFVSEMKIHVVVLTTTTWWWWWWWWWWW
jgi:hypothetical protein